MKILLLFSAWLLFVQTSAFALDVIPLQHRTATELVTSLTPFVSPDGVIRAHNNQLIIKTTAENLIELKQLIKKLDRAPRQLVISVRQPLASETNHQDWGISNRDIQAQSTHSRAQTVTGQQIQTLEGYPATIQVGQAIPVTQARANQVITRYKPISSGFTVIPRLNGDIVTLEINPQVQSLSIIGSDSINIHKAQSTVRGKLGEWIALGGSAKISGSQQGKILYSSRSRSKKERYIFVKVTELAN